MKKKTKKPQKHPAHIKGNFANRRNQRLFESCIPLLQKRFDELSAGYVFPPQDREDRWQEFLCAAWVGFRNYDPAKGKATTYLHIGAKFCAMSVFIENAKDRQYRSRRVTLKDSSDTDFLETIPAPLGDEEAQLETEDEYAVFLERLDAMGLHRELGVIRYALGGHGGGQEPPPGLFRTPTPTRQAVGQRMQDAIKAIRQRLEDAA